MIKKILVPLDGSKLAERALPYAEELADKFKAELILVQILSTKQIPGDLASYPALNQDGTWPPGKEEAELYLKSLQGELRQLQIPAQTIVLGPYPIADALIDLAEEKEIDLIVMSTHGRSGLGRWIYGSVANKILQQAPCPVYLVRAKE